MDLRPGMRVLDLGCGLAASSIFLRREFGVEVWATDLWFSAAENLQRIRDAGVEDGVFPIHADARSLPFADEFFDAIVSIDSFVYFGTDDLYLNYLARFVKPGGQMGIAGAGLVQEVEGRFPSTCATGGRRTVWCLHSAAWWRRHWERTGMVDVELADTMPDGWQRWLDWHAWSRRTTRLRSRRSKPMPAVISDTCRVVGRRNGDTPLGEHTVSVATEPARGLLLRDQS